MNTHSAGLTDPLPVTSYRRLWVALAYLLSYFGLVLNGQIFSRLFPQPLDDGPVIARELINLGMVALIIWVVRRIERQPLASIGLRPRRWVSTSAWAFALAAVCLAAAILTMLVLQACGVTYGDSTAFSRLGWGTITLITIRAGVAEELMMRGYLLERIEASTGSTRLAILLTLIPFALLHFPQGPAGILISFILGGMLTMFYVWRRNLWANMLAHFLVDFTANVVIPLLASLAAT